VPKIGQEISVKDVKDVLEDFKKLKELPGKLRQKEHEALINAFKEINKLIQFYAPRYKELLGEDPFKDLTQPEPAVDQGLGA
jgi:ADP-heptose:LPS heptosyltransferase